MNIRFIAWMQTKPGERRKSEEEKEQKKLAKSDEEGEISRCYSTMVSCKRFTNSERKKQSRLRKQRPAFIKL